ncbi:MAG: hypothetical protein NW208_17845 [Bryobacter sp.]|nr:hypothetical protein [Bryobacter sp.]
MLFQTRLWAVTALMLGSVAMCPAQSLEKQGLEKAAEEFRTLTQEMGLRGEGRKPKAKLDTLLRQWHGRVSWNLRNDKLDATPHEVVQRGGSRNLLRRNQFALNVGGPVVIPGIYDGSGRTFVNFSYEGVRERIGRSFLTTVAIGPERTGDFGQTVDPAGNALGVFDPASTRINPNFDPGAPVSRENLQYLRDPFPNNQIPAARLDPVARRAVDFYPEANASAGPFFRNNYFVFSPEQNTADGMLFKVDHTLAEKHRVTFQGSTTNGIAVASRYFDTIADVGNNDRTYEARRGLVDWTWTKSAATINVLTFDVQRDRSDSSREGQEAATELLGMPGPLGGAFPIFRFGNYLGMGRTFPNVWSSHNYYYLTDGLATRVGKHRLRFTGQYRRFQVNSFQPNYPAGFFQFGPSLTSLPGINNTGLAWASFLLGLSESGRAVVVEHPSYWRGHYFGARAQDQYEVKKNLIVTVNFAYEMRTPRVEKYDRFSTVDLGATNPENGLPGALRFAGRNGESRHLQEYRWRPEGSVAIAWNPAGNSKSVVRANYAFSYGGLPIYTTQWASQGYVARPVYISPNIQLEPAVRLAEGPPELERPLPDLRPEAANFTNADLVEPTSEAPFYQSAGLSYERELPGQTIVSVSLGHARGQRLLVGNAAVNLNAIPLENLEFRDELNSEAFRRTIRPYPQYQRFEVLSSWPLGNYKRHAAALRLEKRSSTGLTLNTTYELSKQLDDYSGPYGVQDFYNRQNEWSLTASNHPQRLSLSFSYELPIGAKKPLLAFQDWRRYLVDGWSLSGITSVQSGTPLALRPQFNNTGGVIEALRVNLVPGVEAAAENRGPESWFNPEAFAQPPDFTAGDGPRTHPQLLGPGFQNHDLSVTKRFAVTTEKVIELSATGFNWINTGNWANPDTVIGPANAPNANAGRSNESRGGRVIQVGLRFSF